MYVCVHSVCSRAPDSAVHLCVSVLCLWVCPVISSPQNCLPSLKAGPLGILVGKEGDRAESREGDWWQGVS